MYDWTLLKFDRHTRSMASGGAMERAGMAGGEGAMRQRAPLELPDVLRPPRTKQ